MRWIIPIFLLTAVPAQACDTVWCIARSIEQENAAKLESTRRSVENDRIVSEMQASRRQQELNSYDRGVEARRNATALESINSAIRDQNAIMVIQGAPPYELRRY